MIDLKEVTFLFPVHIDFPDRKFNIRYVTDYLLENFDTNIIVCTTNDNLNLSDRVTIKKIQTDCIGSRTHLINMGYGFVKTPFVCVNDADVFVRPNVYIDAVDALKNGFDISYPFLQPMYEIKKHELKNFQFGTDYDLLYPDGVGGLFFAKMEKIKESGGENASMIGWGYEDWERFERFQKLEFNINYLEIELYHIKHFRNKLKNHIQGEYNKKIYEQVVLYPKGGVINYIKKNRGIFFI